MAATIAFNGQTLAYQFNCISKYLLVFFSRIDLVLSLNYRKSQGAAILSAAIAGYLMFQHFTRVRCFRKAFDRESIIATSSIICMTVTSLMLVFWSSSSSRHIAAANMKNSVCTLQRTLENLQTNKQTNISFVINLLTRASWQCSLKVLVELHQVWSYWIVCGEERIALSYVHLFLVWSIWNQLDLSAI